MLLGRTGTRVGDWASTPAPAASKSCDVPLAAVNERVQCDSLPGSKIQPFCSDRVSALAKFSDPCREPQAAVAFQRRPGGNALPGAQMVKDCLPLAGFHFFHPLAASRSPTKVR